MDDPVACNGYGAGEQYDSICYPGQDGGGVTLWE